MNSSHLGRLTAVRAEALENSKTGIFLADVGAFDEFVYGAQLFQQGLAIVEKKNASSATLNVSTGEEQTNNQSLDIERAKGLSAESFKE